MKSAQLIEPGKPARDIAPANGKTFTLKELQSYVGGFVELAAQDSDTLMLVNEDGRAMGLPKNDVATRVFREWHGKSAYDVSVIDIVGPAVFVPQSMFD
jgi:hypothetical protein